VDALEKNLEKLAELAVRVGLNLEEGQEVIATAPIEAVDFVRLLAEKAYAQGASPLHRPLRRQRPFPEAPLPGP
jgi:aminopeptidase